MRTFNYLAFALLLLLSLLAAPANAQFGIPGLDPGSIFGKGKDWAKQQMLKEVAKRLGKDAPTVSSADAVFPTVPDLPGQTFQPRGSAHSVLSQLAVTTNGSVMLPPGDYQINVRCNCMKHSAHSPGGHLYLLAPIKGRRAAMIAMLNARAAAASVSAWQVQHMSWDLQAGMSYEQLPANEQSLADQYLSNYKRDLAGSQLDQIKDMFNKYGSKAGFGSFESTLASGEMGDVGKSVLELENFQTLLAGSNTEAGVASLIPRTQSEATGGADNTPWSQVSDRVYGRMFTAGGYQSIGTLQIRVSPEGASSPDTGSAVNVPITSLEGEPQNDNIQPLSMVPQPQDEVKLTIISPITGSKFDATDGNDNSLSMMLQAQVTGGQVSTIQSVHWTFKLEKTDGTQINDSQLSPLDLSSADCIDQSYPIKWKALNLDNTDAIQSELEGTLTITAEANINGTSASNTITVDLNEFSVRDVPNIMYQLSKGNVHGDGFKSAAAMQDHWFDGPPTASTIKADNAINWVLPKYSISMSWVMNEHNAIDINGRISDRIKKAQEYLTTGSTLFSSLLLSNSSSPKIIILHHIKTSSPFSEGAIVIHFPISHVSDGMTINEEIHKSEQVTSYPIDGPIDSRLIPLDPIGLTLGNCSLYAIPIGEATIDKQKNVVHIEVSSVGLYVVKTYHFYDHGFWLKNLLGYWKKPDLVRTTNLTEDSSYHKITQQDYMDWRVEHHYGRDFTIVSTIQTYPLLSGPYRWDANYK